VIRADLIGRWTFDDPANLGADVSGAGNNGTVEGDAAFSSEAMVGSGALLLDGEDDFIKVGLGANNMLAGWSINLSITAWAKPDDLARSWNCFFGHAAQNNGVKFELMGGSYRFTTLAVQDYDLSLSLAADEWFHAAATLDSTGVTFYVNGEEAGKVGGGAPAIAATGEYNVGYGGFWEKEQFQGLLDEVRIYNHVLDADEVARVMLDRGEPYPPASGPKPKNGTMIETVAATIAWRAGDFAVSHDVYFGESLDDVSQATPESVAFQGNQTATEFKVTNLTPGQTYYWRVDEVNDLSPDSPWKGDVWSFWVRPLVAWNPSPADGTRYVTLDQDLSWDKGMTVLFHYIHLGENFDQVDNAPSLSGWPTVNATHDPGPLKPDTTYYWRVDEFTGAVTHKGQVWSFTTVPEVAVTDPDLAGWWTLDEGLGTTAVDWSGHGYHGTLAGDTQWQDGYTGGALYFDGRGDYVNLGAPADLHLAQNYTYTVWFRVGRSISGNSGPQYLLCIGSRSDLVFGVEDAVGVDGDLSLHYYDTAASFHAVGVGQTIWRADEWHMVAGTRDQTGHKIYLDGQLRNSDTNANEDNFGGAMGRMISLGGRAWTGHQYYNGLIDDVRIYSRALAEDEIQQVMRGNPLLAGSPDPGPGAVVDIRDATSLRWQAGDTAASHDVYFGTDKAVVAAAGKDAPEYQGNRSGTSFSLAGLVELGGGDYYWRIDEVEADGTTHTGYVWRLTVPDYLTVDDFEIYTDNFDADEAIWQTWIDGLTDPQNGGSQVGYGEAPFAETRIVHGGGQSMPLDYNNVNSPYYSEADRTWDAAQDWTVSGADTLTLYVRGRADNDAAPLYVALEDSSRQLAVVGYGDDAVVTSTMWIEWNIPLSNFTGVNPAKVKKMYIGLGDRNNPTQGGAGLIYIDDIRVTTPATIR